jgi:YD repeat-containing protein
MSVRIGSWEFDDVAYDRDGDVLYLSIGPPKPGTGEQTPEGHILRYDDAGQLTGITLVGARSLIDAGEPVYVTVPQRSEVSTQELAPALGG